jgi:tetratricopeptide (TPR) repeat protein
VKMHMQDAEGARLLLERAIRLDSLVELAHLDLSIVDAEANRRDEALREWKMADTLNPGDPGVHWRLGRLYQGMGRKEEAKAEFDRTQSLPKAAESRWLPWFRMLRVRRRRGGPGAVTQRRTALRGLKNTHQCYIVRNCSKIQPGRHLHG